MTHQRVRHPRSTAVSICLFLAASVLPALAQEVPVLTSSLEARQLGSEFLEAVECGRSLDGQAFDATAFQNGAEALLSEARTVSDAPVPAATEKTPATVSSPVDREDRVQGGAQREQETGEEADAFPDRTDR